MIVGSVLLGIAIFLVLIEYGMIYLLLMELGMVPCIGPPKWWHLCGLAAIAFVLAGLIMRSFA